MKPEELCEYAATEILGRKRVYKAHESLLQWYYEGADGEFKCRLRDWTPHLDYTQLRMVEEAVGHNFLLVKNESGYRIGTIFNDKKIEVLGKDEEILARLEMAVLCHKEAQGEESS